MKKLLALLLVILSAFFITACNKDNANEFTDLKQNETLYVGDNTFVNVVNEVTTKEYLTYVANYEYVLRRSSYSNSDSIYINNYYYYWSITETTDEAYLGEKTTKSTITHSYLTYGENECDIAVKTIYTTSVDYDYDGGMQEKDFAYSVNLNGYFASLDELKTASTELASKINVSGKKKYYVDTTTPELKDVNVENYTSTYYYVEKNK